MAKKTTINKAKNIAEDYVNFLRTDGLPIEKAILFGSYAKGENNKESDVDICIVSPAFKDPLSTISALLKKRRDIDVDRGIEPIGFNPKDFIGKSSPLIDEINKYGVVL